MLDLAVVTAAELLVACTVAGHDYVESLEGYGIVRAFQELRKIPGRSMSPWTGLQRMPDLRLFHKSCFEARSKCLQEGLALLHSYGYPTLSLVRNPIINVKCGPHISPMQLFAEPASRPGSGKIVAGEDKNRLSHSEWRAGRAVPGASFFFTLA